MVLSYDYIYRNKWRRGTNAPPSQAISMAMAMRRWNTKRISRLRRSRAFIKATKLRQRATTCSVSPRRPPGTQSTQQWATCPSPLLAISMAVAMQQYNTARIAQWRRFVAFIKATKRRHRASTCSDSIKRDTPTPRIQYFQSFRLRRWHDQAGWLRNLLGVTYQWKAKDLANAREYSYGVANIVT